MRFTLTALICSTLALPVNAETSINLSLGAVDSIETMTYTCDGDDPLRVQYVIAGESSLALTDINGTPKIFVDVVSGSGAR
ncbi:MAG: MliC family protein [Sulfitobacter dubius]|uniref:MliC family protein n=1 Tax=Sulfitobacter dubius TaxID=218673 RepID=UPI0008EA734A|nr:MliC family protein [Sulfitobacter dubius]SFH34219.1 Membrane-bound lysozyme-inhibitor of c-type lysozyme [Sulfitobacter dubius]